MASDGSKRAYKKKKLKGEDAAKGIKEAKRLRSGVMNNHDIFSLDDPNFLEGFNKRRAEKLEKDKKAYADKKGKVRKVVNALLGLRGKYGHESTHRFVSLSKDECGTYLQYRKIAGDPKMPKDLQGRCDRCLE